MAGNCSVTPDLRVAVAEDQWNETEYELARRIEIIPRAFYAHREALARRRVPRDPHDWPPVVLALTLDAGILTGDHDFLGCGCPT